MDMEIRFGNGPITIEIFENGLRLRKNVEMLRTIDNTNSLLYFEFSIPEFNGRSATSIEFAKLERIYHTFYFYTYFSSFYRCQKSIQGRYQTVYSFNSISDVLSTDLRQQCFP